VSRRRLRGGANALHRQKFQTVFPREVGKRVVRGDDLAPVGRHTGEAPANVRIQFDQIGDVNERACAVLSAARRVDRAQRIGDIADIDHRIGHSVPGMGIVGRLPGRNFGAGFQGGDTLAEVDDGCVTAAGSQ
jgi:hypothetical protein